MEDDHRHQQFAVSGPIGNNERLMPLHHPPRVRNVDLDVQLQGVPGAACAAGVPV